MRRAARWMIPLEMLLGCMLVVLGLAGGIEWSKGATIYQMLANEGQAKVWLWMLVVNGSTLFLVSGFEFVNGIGWTASRILLWARIRWMNIILGGFQMIFGLKAVVMSSLPMPPLFIAPVTVMVPFLGWAWWDLGKLVLVADKRPEALGRRYDPA